MRVQNNVEEYVKIGFVEERDIEVEIESEIHEKERVGGKFSYLLWRRVIWWWKLNRECLEKETVLVRDFCSSGGYTNFWGLICISKERKVVD